jgi:hypothetical protein
MMHNKFDYYDTFKIESYLAILWKKFNFVKLTIRNLEVHIFFCFCLGICTQVGANTSKEPMGISL